MSPPLGPRKDSPPCSDALPRTHEQRKDRRSLPKPAGSASLPFSRRTPGLAQKPAWRREQHGASSVLLLLLIASRETDTQRGRPPSSVPPSSGQSDAGPP